MSNIKFSKKLFTYGRILLALFFSACNSTEHEEEKIFQSWDRGRNWDLALSEKAEEIIKQDYLEHRVKPNFPDATIEDVWIERYYGTYGIPGEECVVVMMNSNYDEYEDVPSKINIHGKLFHFENENRILVWKDQRQIWDGSQILTGRGFLELSTALRLGWIIPINRVYNCHLGLCLEEQKIFIESYFKDFIHYSYSMYPNPMFPWMEWPGPATWSRYFEYYGTYNGCVVTVINVQYHMSEPQAFDCIGGVEFHIKPSQEELYIGVWKEEDSSSHGLAMAYKQSLLTREDIRNIAHIRSMHWGHERIRLFENGNIYTYDVATGEKTLSVENFDINNFRFYME